MTIDRELEGEQTTEEALHLLTVMYDAENAILHELHPMDFWDANTAQRVRVDAIARAIKRLGGTV